MSLSKKNQFFVVIATTIGGIIEWYELFLYIYWSPLLAKLFFGEDTKFVASINVLLVFFIGFLARPIGGLVFGHIGDRYGRRVSLISSIFLIALPGFAMGALPFAEMGIFAPLVLGLLRFFQSFPAGGELPGAMCYLAESAPTNKRAFICSFAFLGPQIGVIISMLECLFFEKFMSYDFLIHYGWRISFIIGGLLGLLGFYIRHRLKETPAFLHLEQEGKILHRPILESILRHKKEMFFGGLASFLDVVGFYMFSIFLGIYFKNFLFISTLDNLQIAIGSMVLSTITLPFLGKLGDRYNLRKLLIWSAYGMIIFSLPFYVAASSFSLLWTIVFELILMLFLNVQFALLPRFLAELFPTSTRYTGIGMSFNMCDSVIGGLTPLLALLSAKYIGDVTTFAGFIVLASLISLMAFYLMKINDRKINY